VDDLENNKIDNASRAVDDAIQGGGAHKTGTARLSRRSCLGVSSTALATAALGELSAHAQEAQDVSASDPGQENKSLLDENPSSNPPPPTDRADISPIWYSFDLAHKRVQEGGWTYEVNQRVLPSSPHLAGGKGRMTVIMNEGRARTMDFNANDVGFVPRVATHYIENTGDTDCAFLEMLKPDHSSTY
jgi:oxalate decarboxylase